MAFRYRCPEIECRKTFLWEAKDMEPQCCPHCGYTYADPKDDVICLPNILSARSKSIESVARGIMDGSEKRIEMAAEMTGGSVEDFSSLKITDMNDGRHSEFAVKDVSNPVVDVMKATPGISGFQQNGAAFAGNTRVGPHANAGAKFATKLTTQHQTHKQVLSMSGKRG